MKNHIGKYECKLCLTLHNNEGSYLAHTQGKKHQENLYVVCRRNGCQWLLLCLCGAPLRAWLSVVDTAFRLACVFIYYSVSSTLFWCVLSCVCW